MQSTTQDLWSEGRKITITAGALSPSGNMVLTWTVPQNPIAYNGFVVLVSEQPLFADNRPVDGTRYIASSNWTAPSSKIGEASVVAAAYGFFGDDITVNTVTVSNLDPSKLYYASIHACSNVLQYYTPGSTSYPLESNRPVKKNSAYAGSIPQSSTAPENPNNGQVYYDVNTNSVLMWNDEQSAWLRANSETVIVAEGTYIDTGAIFYDTGNAKIVIFDGVSWIDATPANMRVKMGATWAPYSGVASESGSLPTAPNVGDFILQNFSAEISAPRSTRLKFYSLGQWFDASEQLIQVFLDGQWTNIPFINQQNMSGIPAAAPTVGRFLYNTSTNDLLVWTGSSWSKADTAHEGEPTYDKTHVGTDGTNDSRLQLIREVKMRMGWPSVCVELQEDQFSQAINNALATFRQLSDSAYEHRHISFTVIRGQDQYYLNDPRDGTNRIVNIIKIHRVNQLGAAAQASSQGVYAQAFFNQLFGGAGVDVLSIHLMHQLSEVYEKIFAGNIVFTWDESYRKLTLLRNIHHPRERVVLEAVMERSEQDLIGDRWCRMWLQDWTYADVMEQLGMIRTKYGNLPAASGSMTLNGDTLLTKSAELKTELRRQINDFEVGNGGVQFGSTAFLMG